MWVYRDKESGALDGAPFSGYLRKNRRQGRSREVGGNMRLQQSLLLLSALGCFAISGCGGQTSSSSSCQILAINVSPATATVDHAAAPPANTQHFDAFIAKAPPGCAFITGNVFDAVWSVSDPVNVSISNAQD